MNTLRPIDSILLLAVVLLAIGQVYTIFGGQRLDTTGGTPLDASSRTEGVVAIPPSNVLTPIGGKVKTVEAGELVVTNEGGDVRITIASDTALVLQGARKSDADFAADIAAFRQQSFELVQDSEKNHEALASLIAPSPFEEMPVSLKDITPGVSVSAFVRTSGEAVKVVVIR